MRASWDALDELRAVLADADEPLTAREILRLLDESTESELESSHRVATVLGRWATRGDVEVVCDSPYRYWL